MKNINKDVYQEAKYGRKTLMIISTIALIISLAMLGGGIALIVLGSISKNLSNIVWMLIFGIVLVILGVVFGIFSLIMLFTSLSMIKVKEGSVKDGNRAIGTVNVVKCDKCGIELPDNAIFCSKCGTAVDGRKVCTCGEQNLIDAEFCVKCGNKLN